MSGNNDEISRNFIIFGSLESEIKTNLAILGNEKLSVELKGFAKKSGKL